MRIKNLKHKKSYIRLKKGESRFILLLGDIIFASIALLIALYFWAQDDWLKFSLEFVVQRPPNWFYILPIGWIILLIDIYDIQRASKREDTIKGVSLAALISLGIYLVVYFTSPPNSLPRRGVAVFILAAFILTFIWRLLYIRIFTAPVFMSRVLIVGAGRAGETFSRVIKKMWPLPFYVVGFIDDDPNKIGEDINGFPILGNCNDLSNVIEKYQVSDIVFSISGDMSPDMFQSIINAGEQGIEVTTMPTMYEELLSRVPILLLQSDWIIRSFLDQSQTGSLYKISKRLLDIIGGLVGLFILIILLPFISILILLDSGAPIIYKQDRLGKNGKEYKIIKFRTMYKDAEIDGKAKLASQNDARITKVGRLLRKSHLDELPQFINILSGEMSLVGPRAERKQLVDKLQNDVPFYRARLLVKPGLTGWAQINFGYASSIEDNTTKLEFDLYYIKHRNLFMDILILIQTVGTVIGFKGR